jgi:sporulation protein YlmC with PRC-barrel domain
MGGISDTGSMMRDQARMNSQGPAHASATGIAHANENSVLAGTTATRTATSGPLAGLTTGTTLYSNGTAVGTVQQIRITGQGTVAMVVVKGTNGGLYAVPANKLTFTGGTLSTSVRLAGVNDRTMASTTTAFNNPGAAHSQALMHASPTAISHANFHSVLAAGTVVSGSLAGLTTGLTVNNHSGTMLGTVSQIVTDSSGNVRLVIVTSSTGQTYRLAPTSLTLSGGVVTTTQI